MAYYIYVKGRIDLGYNEIKENHEILVNISYLLKKLAIITNFNDNSQ